MSRSQSADVIVKKKDVEQNGGRRSIGNRWRDQRRRRRKKKTCRQSATSAGPHFRSIVRRTGGYWWPLHNGWEKNERNKSIKRSLQAWKEIRGHSLVDNYFPIVSGPQKVTNTSSGQAKTSWDTQPSLEATACVPSNQLRSFVLSFTFPEWLWGFDHRWNKNKK